MWLLLLVPLLAIGATTAYLWNAAPDVHTFATISVIAPEGQSTAATVTQAVDGFKSAYRAKLSEVTQLRLALATGDSSVNRDAVQERLQTANAELAKIGQSVNAFENVQDQVTRTRGDLATANQELDSVSTRQEAASADE